MNKDQKIFEEKFDMMEEGNKPNVKRIKLDGSNISKIQQTSQKNASKEDIAVTNAMGQIMRVLLSHGFEHNEVINYLIFKAKMAAPAYN